MDIEKMKEKLKIAAEMLDRLNVCGVLNAKKLVTAAEMIDQVYVELEESYGNSTEAAQRGETDEELSG